MSDMLPVAAACWSVMTLHMSLLQNCAARLHTRRKRPQVMLMSRDEMSMLVVSYADLKRCVEGAFGELSARASQARARPLARR